VSLFGLQGVSRSSFSELWNEVRQISIAGVFLFFKQDSIRLRRQDFATER